MSEYDQQGRQMTALEMLNRERDGKANVAVAGAGVAPPNGPHMMERIRELEAQMREYPETLARRMLFLEKRIAELETALFGSPSKSLE